MIFKGIVMGKTIELEESLPYPDGQSVSVTIDVYAEQKRSGSPSILRKVMHEFPHLQWTDVDVLEREIEQAKLPVTQNGSFDEER